MIMEKIELKNVDKTIYREVLDNGLEIIILTMVLIMGPLIMSLFLKMKVK